ncbi:MAG: hypothetical protein IT323_12145 [Anaerolineae bacterium]|nr:hypothetical protein [Anaerolineae bacterium]
MNMKLGTREILIGLLIVVAVAAVLSPGFAMSILGAIQAISIIILCWVAIFYLIKRI